MDGYYHVGIVVPDLESAQVHFTELLGVAWGPVIETELPVRLADGTELTVPNKICYSTEHPHLELIQEAPGTPWVCNEHSNLHHIGVFVDALTTERDRLDAAACPLEIMDGHGDGPPQAFTYHRDPLGVRIEIVSSALRPMMEELMFGPPAG